MLLTENRFDSPQITGQERATNAAPIEGQNAFGSRRSEAVPESLWSSPDHLQIGPAEIGLFDVRTDPPVRLPVEIDEG